MAINQETINKIINALNKLNREQKVFKEEILDLKKEIKRLKISNIIQEEKSVKPEIKKKVLEEKEAKIVEKPILDTIEEKSVEPVKSKIIEPTLSFDEEKSVPNKIKPNPQKSGLVVDDKSSFERFIGENVINKIGIGITIIGVGIGVKYSIEHDLIGPLARVIIGYLIGLGILGVGIKLKKKYLNFSSVLVSGAMAIMYLVTYFAYNIYGFYSQGIAFVIMTLFTAFTVFAAINYNKQIIAHIGLVGAYAVPFFLSNSSGRPEVLFTYMTIINIGILIISFKKYWKPLYYTSFGATWLIYLSWFLFNYSSYYFGIAITFLLVFYVIFYLTFLAYKFIKKENFANSDILLLLLNSTFFFGIGYAILNGHETGKHYLGLFAVINAVIHFAVLTFIHKKNLIDKNLYYFVAALVLTFLTIAIPIQLDGNYVTILWAVEAALLFWIGRVKKLEMFEKFSFPLMIIAFASIVFDWAIMDNYSIFSYTKEYIAPIFNKNFLTSMVVIASFVFVGFLSKKHVSSVKNNHLLEQFKFYIPVILLALIYFAFRMEIVNYWGNLFESSKNIAETKESFNLGKAEWNYDLEHFKSIWVLNYSMFFVTILTFINLKFIKNKVLGIVSQLFFVLMLILFLTQGLYEISELRESFVSQKFSEYYDIGMYNIIIRYISIVIFSVFLFAFYKTIKERFVENRLNKIFEFILHISILWVLSSELIHWLDLSGSTKVYKLGLSILWGVYSLFLVFYGFIKNNQKLRIAGVSLMGFTLVKLFFYDLINLNLLSKTIIFISLGILMLLISFLYTKFNNQDDEE